MRIPAGAEPLDNRAGLAPGFLVGIGRARAFFLPGVPRELKPMFEAHVEPRVAALAGAAGAQ
ncbi:damage-inducible protein CinA, partial [Candidatus Sumerlaeota bacterium]|nr:damage-inducible protein CinA [Candidatus Sumerlaeota bacterium]